jgi:hypothetical protein
MATVKDYKSQGKVFSNAEEWIEVKYDFAKDAGAQAALDLFIATSPLVITGFIACIDTACLGAGGTLTVGIGAGTVPMNALGVASLTIGASINQDPDLDTCLKMATNDVMKMTIGGGNFTAGVVRFKFKVMSF